jgi:hypothetical protein
MNCPDALRLVFEIAVEQDRTLQPVEVAELMREVGLKCISFNGIARTINCLGAYISSLPPLVVESLSKTPTRGYTSGNIASRLEGGRKLWNSVYNGFEDSLVEKLAASHPDLPVHILNGHYSNLLSDPPAKSGPAKVGRVLTSLVGISCLRAQTGVGPQVTSHVFGLRKAFELGHAFAEGEPQLKGGAWLASDEGNLWILRSIDSLVEAISAGSGSSFAPGFKSRI